jgi:hypothetical protein
MSWQRDVVQRLHAQWPGIGADEPGTRDWARVVSKVDEGTAKRACDRLIESWNKDRAPRPADWQDTCRGVRGRSTATPHMDRVEATPRGFELIAEAREKARRARPLIGGRGPGD